MLRLRVLLGRHPAEKLAGLAINQMYANKKSETLASIR